MGLAALVSSALTSAESPSSIVFLILDCGIASRTKRRLSRLASEFGADMQFFPVDLSAIGRVDTTGHAGASAYSRLLSPAILHDQHGKVVYLDSDLIVRRDIRALLDHEVDEDTWAWAVPEVGVPFVSSPTAVFDWKERGLDPQARYFNSGVLMFDLDTWRRKSVPEQTLDYLRMHGSKVSWWDQGGLNVTLYGRWRPLDLRWNQTYCILEPKARWIEAGFDVETLASVKAAPFVVHFNGAVKPWQYGCDDPRAPQFFECLSGTPWKNVRPRTPFLLTPLGCRLRAWYRASGRLLRPLRNTVAGMMPRQRRARRDEHARQREYSSFLQLLLKDPRVRSGPFAGMKYVPAASWGHIGPRLLGAYESELHDTLETLIACGYNNVIDVGCAEGYYVVGLARRLPGAMVHGFDIDPAALELCRQMADLNEVGERVCLCGACTPEALNELIDGSTLVIMDCEGAEIDLLLPQRAPRLEQVDLLVELHDFIDPTISSRIIARFEATHEITLIDVETQDPRKYPELDGWRESIQKMVLDDQRPTDPHPMQWGLFRRKAAG